MSSPRLSNPDKRSTSMDSPASSHYTAEPWLDDACISDMNKFVKSLSGIKTKGIRPDLIGSVISHYATKWLPELSRAEASRASSGRLESPRPLSAATSPESSMAAWMKKKFFVETLVSVLPPEKDCLTCNFLLRLLRVASMLGTDSAYIADLEARVAWQLDQASLKELMIPAFSHTCGTLLDVDMVLRLVRRFVGMDDAVKSGSANVKVAKLVDGYLAEAAVDANLKLSEFEALAGALPSHARATDDGLYRAMDTYLKAHPNTTKHERKMLFNLIDTRKLSSEACLHAAQNERLPVRAAMQVLFSEQTKLHRLADLSGSFSGPRSPTLHQHPPLSSLPMLELSARCPSKREVIIQQQELRKLRDDMARLQTQCHSLQSQIDRLVEKNKKKGYFRWRSLFRNTDAADKTDDDEVGVMHRTPGDKKSKPVQGKSNTPIWRKSMS